jgi:hypothetical protein
MRKPKPISFNSTISFRSHMPLSFKKKIMEKISESIEKVINDNEFLYHQFIDKVVIDCKDTDQTIKFYV